MSTIASYSPLNISETVRELRLGSRGPPTGNGLRTEWSRDSKSNTLKAQYLENSWFRNNR